MEMAKCQTDKKIIYHVCIVIECFYSVMVNVIHSIAIYDHSTFLWLKPDFKI